MKRYIRADIVDINDEDEELLYELATTGTNQRELAHLAKSTDSLLRERVAGNTNASSEVLWLLANDTHIGVRVALAQNPNTPRDLKDYIISHRGTKSGYYEYKYYLYYPEELSENDVHAALSKLAHDTAGTDYEIRLERFYDSYHTRVVYTMECGPFQVQDIDTPYKFDDAMRAGVVDILGYDLDYTEVEALIQ